MEVNKEGRFKSKKKSNSKSINQTAISNELRSSDNSEKLVDFGSKIGVVWEEKGSKEEERQASC